MQNQFFNPLSLHTTTKKKQRCSQAYLIDIAPSDPFTIAIGRVIHLDMFVNRFLFRETISFEKLAGVLRRLLCIYSLMLYTA